MFPSEIYLYLGPKVILLMAGEANSSYIFCLLCISLIYMYVHQVYLSQWLFYMYLHLINTLNRVVLCTSCVLWEEAQWSLVYNTNLYIIQSFMDIIFDMEEGENHGSPLHFTGFHHSWNGII